MNQQKLNYSLNLKLKRNEVFFGPGVVRLLQCILETESINAASKRLGMSYNKAWRILSKAEKEIGFKLIEKNVGGSNGGGSTLTVDGRKYMEKYLLFQEKMYVEADKCFKEIFEDYLNER